MLPTCHLVNFEATPIHARVELIDQRRPLLIIFVGIAPILEILVNPMLE